MSVFIDAVIRWLLRQPAVSRFLAAQMREEIRTTLKDQGSDTRRAMLRIIRSEARDLFDEQRERARETIELSAEHQRAARQERERVLADAAAHWAKGRSAYVQLPGEAAVLIVGTAEPKPYESPSDPLSGPWDAPPPPRCQVCSEPIRWRDGPLSGGRWIHANTPPNPFHVARYALADVEQTAVLPIVSDGA